eukprot:gene13939-biopygen8061
MARCHVQMEPTLRFRHATLEFLLLDGPCLGRGPNREGKRPAPGCRDAKKSKHFIICVLLGGAACFNFPGSHFFFTFWGRPGRAGLGPTAPGLGKIGKSAAPQAPLGYFLSICGAAGATGALCGRSAAPQAPLEEKMTGMWHRRRKIPRSTVPQG